LGRSKAWGEGRAGIMIEWNLEKSVGGRNILMADNALLKDREERGIHAVKRVCEGEKRIGLPHAIPKPGVSETR